MPLPAATLLLDWDRRWTRRLNASQAILPVRRLLRVASRLGDGVFWYSAMLALALTQGQPGRHAAARMALAGLLALGIYKLLKRLTARPRPCEALSGVRAGISPLDAHSFPSGHTLHAVAFTVAGVAQMPELALIFVPFTALVALSRVVLGLHYPSDVLAGALIGAAVAQVVVLAV